jgi:HJR/Mrr/RecB family endonuclease
MKDLHARPPVPTIDDHLRELELRLHPVLGLVLAAMFYVVLQHPAPDRADLHQLASFGLAAITYLGQFVIPALLIVGSAVAMTLQTRRGRIQAVTPMANLANLSWRGLEKLTAWYFRGQGYRVRVLGGARPDGGIDLLIQKSGGTEILVQCKLRHQGYVGVKDVRELYGTVMRRGGSTEGILVTAGGFSKEAVKFAKGTNLDLISGHEFARLIETDRFCPTHGQQLSLKVAGHGDLNGFAFLGCPCCGCKYKLSMH